MTTHVGHARSSLSKRKFAADNDHRGTSVINFDILNLQ